MNINLKKRILILVQHKIRQEKNSSEMKSTAGTLQNIPIKSSESPQLKNISNSNE